MFALLVLFTGGVWGQSADGLWDVSRGVTITASSGGGWNSLSNMFGANLPSPEAGVAFFRDDRPAGFAHFVEWRTPVAVRLRAFRLLAKDDPADNPGDRGFSQFRLYARVAGETNFTLLQQYSPGNPYPGNSVNYSNNVAAVVAREFRAEFVQYAGSNSPGPRILELEGYGDWNPCQTPPAGLYAWWPAEGNAEDVVGGANGTLLGATFGVGVRGQAFEFHGADAVMMPGYSYSAEYGDFSIEGWLKTTSTNDYSTVVSFDVYNPALYVMRGGELYLYPAVHMSSVGGFNDGRFHHFALVRQNGIFTYYKDGVAAGSTYTTLPLYLWPDDFVVGWDGSVADYFTGLIDELSLYARALTPAEVQSLYAAGAAGKCWSTVAILQQPVSQTVYAGGTARFAVAATNSEPLTYQWYFENEPIPGAEGPVLVVTNAQRSDMGYYFVVVRDQYSGVASESVYLEVIPGCVRMGEGMVAWWEAESNALDSASVNHGLLLNGAGFAAGKRGLAFRLDGVNDYVQAPAAASLSITGALSIEAWIYATNVNPAQVIVSKYNGAFNRTSWGLQILNGGVQFYISADGTPLVAALAETEAGILAPNSWTHLVAVFDPDWQVMRIFINGWEQPVFVRQYWPVNIYSLFDSAEPVRLGACADDATGALAGFFGGLLDEVTLYNRALWDDEIYQLFEADAAGKCRPPIILQQPQSVTVAPGASATFSVAVSGLPPFQYQWRLNAEAIPGATNATWTVTNAQPASAGNYTVVVHDLSGAAFSQPATLSLNIPSLAFADHFANRQVITLTQNTLSGVGRGSNLTATREPGEPLHAGEYGVNSVWITFISPVAGIARFSLEGSSFDTLLAAYTGNNLATLTPVAWDDDSAGFLASEILFNVEAGTPYHLAVDGWWGAAGDIVLNWNIEATSDLLPRWNNRTTSIVTAEGASVDLNLDILLASAVEWYFNGVPFSNAFQLDLNGVNESQIGTYYARLVQDGRRVSSQPIDVQYNRIDGRADSRFAARDKFQDSFDPSLFHQAGLRQAGRKPLVRASGPTRGHVGTQVFNTFGASAEEGEPIHCGVVGGASRWFSYQAPERGTLTIHTGGSDFDTILAVYFVPGNVPPNSFDELVSVACDNNGYTNNLSFVRFVADSNMVYYIAVDGVGGATGIAKINYELASLPEIIQQPQSLTAPQGSSPSLAVTATGTNLLYQWRLESANMAGATNRVLVLTNIQPAAAGRYRVVVSNSAGAVTSSVAMVDVVSQLVHQWRRSNGLFRLELTNLSTNRLLKVQGSANLSNWVDLLSTNLSRTTFDYTPPATSNRLFLRALQTR